MQKAVMWNSGQFKSVERCVLSSTPTGFRFTGLLLLPLDSQVSGMPQVPASITYTIDINEQWRTRRVEIEQQTLSVTSTLVLISDGRGHWQVEGQDMPSLTGCLDIDLSVTPATNTLPIRRLPLQDGETAAVSAAWIRFPGLDIERLDQHYSRIDSEHYLYQTGDFTAEISVDDLGLVQEYADLWARIAEE
jgi:uncharacterized protein